MALSADSRCESADLAPVTARKLNYSFEQGLVLKKIMLPADWTWDIEEGVTGDTIDSTIVTLRSSRADEARQRQV
ncbi:MAG: hypothetical protein ACU836_16980 [Gammaproteobacteria bacterium]